MTIRGKDSIHASVQKGTVGTTVSLVSDTFIEFLHSEQFLNKVLQFFNEENVTSFTEIDELLFGKFVNIGQLQQKPLLKKLNYCMLFKKYYLYHQKYNQMETDPS